MGAIADTHNGIANMYRAIRAWVSSNSQSLPQRAQRATAVSRVYIGASVADEEIMMPLIGVLNQLYLGYVLTVLSLESVIARGRTVADITQVVATEGLIDPITLADRAFGGVSASTEDFGDKFDDIWNEQSPEYHGIKGKSGGAKLVELNTKEQHLVTGRVVDLDITTESGGIVPLRVAVQLIPRVLSDLVAGAFLGLNTDASISRRLRQVRVGQISFFHDFIFALDRIKKLKEALKQDSSGDLSDMLSQQSNSLAKHGLNLTRISNGYNSASGVMIISKEAFERELSDAGATFDTKSQQSFFSKSYMMMLAVIDQAHNIVDLYTHGIKGHAEYSFASIEKVGSSKSGIDVKDVMSLMSQGNAPRF